ncbi:hypothetical protein ACOME3_010491 [Neoechinorhynchus agilis]
MSDKRPQLRIDPRTGEYYIPSYLRSDGTWTERIVFRPARINNEQQRSNNTISSNATINENLNHESQQRSNRTRSVPRPNQINYANRNSRGSAPLARYQPDRSKNELSRSNSATYSVFRSGHQNKNSGNSGTNVEGANYQNRARSVQRALQLNSPRGNGHEEESTSRFQTATLNSAINTAGHFNDSGSHRAQFVQNHQNPTLQQPQTTTNTAIGQSINFGGIQNVNVIGGFPAQRFTQLPFGQTIQPMPQLMANMQALSLGNQVGQIYPLNQPNAAYGLGCGATGVNQFPSGFLLPHQLQRIPNTFNAPNHTFEADKPIDEGEALKTQPKKDHLLSTKLYINRKNGDHEEKVPVIVELSIRADDQTNSELRKYTKGGIKNSSLRPRHRDNSNIPSYLWTYLRPAQRDYIKNNKVEGEPGDIEDIEDVVFALEREEEMPPIPEKFTIVIQKPEKEQKIPEWFTCHNDEQWQDIGDETFMEEFLMGDDDMEILKLNADTLNTNNKDMAFIMKSLANSKVHIEAVTIVNDKEDKDSENNSDEQN